MFSEDLDGEEIRGKAVLLECQLLARQNNSYIF